jgi:hypothetical protein
MRIILTLVGVEVEVQAGGDHIAGMTGAAEMTTAVAVAAVTLRHISSSSSSGGMFLQAFLQAAMTLPSLP